MQGLDYRYLRRNPRYRARAFNAYLLKRVSVERVVSISGAARDFSIKYRVKFSYVHANTQFNKLRVEGLAKRVGHGCCCRASLNPHAVDIMAVEHPQYYDILHYLYRKVYDVSLQTVCREKRVSMAYLYKAIQTLQEAKLVRRPRPGMVSITDEAWNVIEINREQELEGPKASTPTIEDLL